MRSGFHTLMVSVLSVICEHHSKRDRFWRNFRERTEMGLQFSLRSNYHAWRGGMGENNEILV